MSYTDLDLVSEQILPNGERGIIAKKDIFQGTIIGIYDGLIHPIPIINGRLCPTYQHKAIVQISMDSKFLYGLITPDGSAFYGIDYINHSCEPNIEHRNQVVLYAQRNIKANEPLTLDYRTWDLIPENIQCWCKESKCII